MTGAYALPTVAFDPLTLAPICLTAPAAGDASDPGHGPLADRAGCASDCCQTFVSTTPAAAPSPAVTLARRIEWRAPPADVHVERAGFVRRARGPPLFS